MSTDHDTHPDVALFVADVRARLADLDPDQRDELLEGLEADLSEQVADGGPDLLADPASYAAELRAAAGLPPAPRRSRRPRLDDEGFDRALDALRARWDEQVSRHRATREAWSVAVALRPAWWALRAWVLVTVLDQATGPSEAVSLVPHLGVPLLGPLVLLAAVALSVLVGLGRVWPGTAPRDSLARLTLLVVNVVAVLAPVGFSTADPFGYESYAVGYADAQADASRAGVVVDGRRVSNLFPYDASGQPLQGVQLVDQQGRPVALEPRQAQSGARRDRVVGCPWVNGEGELWNVFPLPERSQERLGCRTGAGRSTGQVGPVQQPTPPLAQLPPVTQSTGTP